MNEPERRNAHGQPIGPALPDWTARAQPPATAMVGRHCRLEPLDVTRHGDALAEALAAPSPDWTYLIAEPPESRAAFRERLIAMAASRDPLFSAVVDAAGTACGLVSHLRIDPANGAIEVGHIHYGDRLKRSPAGTEAMALMMARAFDELGYRRCEWKCDALNAPSRRAALRYGFAFEGIFRQALVMKGRNRDTAWFSITDREWPALRAAFAAWLDPGNFDADGRQRRALAALRAT